MVTVIILFQNSNIIFHDLQSVKCIRKSCLKEFVYFVSHYFSYKRFIPESLNRNIKQRNILTRIRINNVFKKFLSDFNRRTVSDSNITMYDLKIKYLATLEGLTSGLGSETFEPLSVSVMQEGDLCNGGYYGKMSGVKD